MQLEIRFFASFRERLGMGQASLQVPDELGTLGELLDWLPAHRPDWHALFDDGDRLMFAVNQSLATPSHPLSDGDEVAFFPPVTGG